MSQNNGNDWITNKVKNAVTKRDELCHKWVSDPSDIDRETYNKTRTSKFGTISKAQKAQKKFFGKKRVIFEKNFLSKKVALCRKK